MWDWLHYPNDESDDILCYSPNYEYYIIRSQSIFSATQDQLYVTGTANLYDKNHKLLYKGKAPFGEAGPVWSVGVKGDLKHRPSVYFQGDNDWYYQLPISPGHDPKHFQGCFSPIKDIWTAKTDMPVFAFSRDDEKKILFNLKAGEKCTFSLGPPLYLHYELDCEKGSGWVRDKENFAIHTIYARKHPK